MESAFEAVASRSSVRSTVKEDEPVVVGAPVMAPDGPSRDRPSGRLPEWMDHE